MPLPERVIEPVAVCRGTLQLPVPDELEGVTNGSLANIIRQLSTLSRHAEEMFGNLFTEAEVLAVRGSTLQARIDKIAVKVTQLDSSVEEVTLQEIQLRKAFRSTQIFDQQVLSRDFMPKSMLEQYLACDKPPPLDKLNPYREDGKDGIKFYTDANYFFELWRSEMLQSTEKAEKVRRGGLKGSRMDGNRQKKRLRPPHSTADRHRKKALNDGEYIMDDGGGRANYSVHFNLPESVEYGGMPGDYDHGPHHRPTTIDIQGGEMYPGMEDQYPRARVVRFEDNRYSQEPIYTPRILREPERTVQFDMSHLEYIPDSENSSRAGTPQRRPANPPPAPPPGSTPTRPPLGGRDSLPPPPPPPASQEFHQEDTMAIDMQKIVVEMRAMPHFSSPSHQQQPTAAADLTDTDPDLPPPPPVPDSNNLRSGHHLLDPSPPPPPPSAVPSSSPHHHQPAPAPPPPPPPPPPIENGVGGGLGANNSPMKAVLNSISSGPPQLRKTVIPENPKEDVRSDLLKAIRDGISLKKVEQKEAADQSTAAGLSDVASILARRVALEVSDSDDGPTDSEYDSDEWGETEA